MINHSTQFCLSALHGVIWLLGLAPDDWEISEKLHLPRAYAYYDNIIESLEPV